MKSYLILALSIFFIGTQLNAQAVIKATDLETDFQILKKALEELHPGLYKYASKEAIDADFAALKDKLSDDQDMLSVYKEISLFTAKVQCGHTYGNFWNQSDSLRNYFTNARNKVPFTFRIIDQEAYIYQNLSQHTALSPGDRIESLNGIPMKQVLEELKRFVKADGANDGKRLFDLQVFALDNYEAFDIYLPFVIDLDSTIRLQLSDYESGKQKDAEVTLLTRKERFDLLTERYGKQIESYDDYWNFEILENNIGYLQIGTFVTWKMKLNWRQFLDDAFSTLQKQQIPHLIIDIRGNEGGDAAVQALLYKKLRNKLSENGPFQQTLKTNYVSDEIRPYLETWSNEYYDMRNNTVAMSNGFYTFKKEGMIMGTKKAEKGAYTGNVYLLADASNSSGTYFLINYLKNNYLATVVGQTSGGNQQGITGGQMFMLQLPNSGIEVDIPIIGFYPPTDKPNKGIEPDVKVELTVEDLVAERDAVFERAVELIQTSGNKP